MTASSTVPVSLRIETGARDLFRELAEHHGVTESVLLEQLTIEEAAPAAAVAAQPSAVTPAPAAAAAAPEERPRVAASPPAFEAP